MFMPSQGPGLSQTNPGEGKLREKQRGALRSLAWAQRHINKGSPSTLEVFNVSPEPKPTGKSHQGEGES